MAVRFTGKWTKAFKKFDLDYNPYWSVGLLNKIGEFVAKAIQRNIYDKGQYFGKPFRPNAPTTRNNSQPLIGVTKQLVESADFYIKNDLQVFVGVFKEAYPTRGRSRRVYNIAAILEKGTTKAGRSRNIIIPERPYISPMLESPAIKEGIEKVCQEYFEDVFGMI